MQAANEIMKTKLNNTIKREGVEKWDMNIFGEAGCGFSR